MDGVKTERGRGSDAFERSAGNGRDGGEEGGDEGYGEADDVEVTALDAGNPAGRAALDGVGAGFVHRLFGGNVSGDAGVREGEEVDGGGLVGGAGGVRSDESDAGEDFVDAAGEEAQHAGSVIGVYGLAEDVAVEGDGGVGAQDGQAGVAEGRGIPDSQKRGIRSAGAGLG